MLTRSKRSSIRPRNLENIRKPLLHSRTIFSMASPSPVGKLPTELLLKIFKSLDNIADATRLVHISRRFHKFWTLNTRIACVTILLRSFMFYEPAVRLVNAIIQRKCDSTSLSRNHRHAAFLNHGINKANSYYPSPVLHNINCSFLKGSSNVSRSNPTGFPTKAISDH